ncbi:MAG TPA: hypothetical protein VEV41_13205 [Terriglobales bacterium]|nr:hypothetical protein [Terriglobales bacterium]
MPRLVIFLAVLLTVPAIVPVNGGSAKNITADNPASDSTPL